MAKDSLDRALVVLQPVSLSIELWSSLVIGWSTLWEQTLIVAKMTLNHS